MRQQNLKARHKVLTLAAGMLIGSSAFAVTYEVPADYRSSFCNPIRDALADGMLLDANGPICERRFRLSPRAKRFGLSPIRETLLPASRYPELLREILPVSRHERSPQSGADRIQDDAVVERFLTSGSLKILSARFDADNSGKSATVYVVDYSLCNDPDSWSETNPAIYIKRDNGTFDSGWDGNYATGNPFMYDGRTYYARWQSLRGSVLKNVLAKVDIYESVPFDSAHNRGSSSAGFTSSYCEIYQRK